MTPPACPRFCYEWDAGWKRGPRGVMLTERGGGQRPFLFSRLVSSVPPPILKEFTAPVGKGLKNKVKKGLVGSTKTQVPYFTQITTAKELQIFQEIEKACWETPVNLTACPSALSLPSAVRRAR